MTPRKVIFRGYKLSRVPLNKRFRGYKLSRTPKKFAKSRKFIPAKVYTFKVARANLVDSHTIQLSFLSWVFLAGGGKSVRREGGGP